MTIKLDKIYTQKSNATADIRKAIKRGEIEAGTHEAISVEGGFQIFKVATEPVMLTDMDKAMASPDADGWTGTAIVGLSTVTQEHMDVLKALLGAKVLADTPIEERAGIWILFSSVYDSENPTDLPKNRMGGLSNGLKRRGLIQTATGEAVNGKKGAIVAITEAGLAVLGIATDKQPPADKPASLYERTKAAVHATGNIWAIDNFHATHG